MRRRLDEREKGRSSLRGCTWNLITIALAAALAFDAYTGTARSASGLTEE